MRSAAHLSIESMCRLGQVSRAGFYRHWKQHEPRVEQAELRARMHQIVLTHRRHYGYRRVTHELRNQGWAVNHKRVARLMAEDNLLCLRKRSFMRHDRLPPRSARLAEPGRAHAADRDRPALGGRHHLSAAGRGLPLSWPSCWTPLSRHVLGWALDQQLDARLAVAALR